MEEQFTEDRDSMEQFLKRCFLIAMMQKYHLADTEEKRDVWAQCLELYKELEPEHGILKKYLGSLEIEIGMIDFYHIYLNLLLEEKEAVPLKSMKQQIDICLFLIESCHEKEAFRNVLKSLYDKVVDKYKERVTNDAYLRNYILYLNIRYMTLLGTASEEELAVAGKMCDFLLLAERECEGKDNEEKLEIWEEAIYRNTKFDKFEETERCYEEIFRLLDPIFGVFDEADSEKSGIGFLWNKGYGRIQNLLSMKDYDKINKVVVDLYEKLVQYETHNQEFARRVFDLAKYLRQAELHRPANILGLLSVYIGLTEEPDKQFLRAAFPERGNSVALITEKLAGRLKQSVTPALAGPVCENIEVILDWSSEEEDFQAIKKELEWFLAKYREVEFK